MTVLPCVGKGIIIPTKEVLLFLKLPMYLSHKSGPNLQHQIFQCFSYYIFLQLAFPYIDYAPALFLQQPVVFLVTNDIAANFLFPIFWIVFWPYKVFAPLVAVPETPIHKYHSLILGQYNIRFSGETAIIFTIAKTFEKQVLPDQLFRFCIFVANSGHVVASCFRRMYICPSVIPP